METGMHAGSVGDLEVAQVDQALHVDSGDSGA